MADIFISYARSTAREAQQVAEALRALGYGVWRDDELPAHRAYTEVIQERLTAARAVVVIWSAEAVKSQWVRAEADAARELGTLVQLSVDGAVPPMPFNQIQCADLAGWMGEADASGWKKVVASVGDLTGGRDLAPSAGRYAPEVRKLAICVLPFANMSDDPQQEYFSDGISEDIITDLSKVSALFIVARNTAFAFKGKATDIEQIARQLRVSHVLEGSVRKAGQRVRITAQLIDGSTGGHVWAERWDRDLTDIFALQDEISQAIVAALKLKLLPEEKKAIEKRGTDSVEAYNLYLMARQYLFSGNTGDARAVEATVRLCRRATENDPDYARAWALMAEAQTELRFTFGMPEQDGLIAAERALALDSGLAEAHAVRGFHLAETGQRREADLEIELALSRDPASYEVNILAGRVRFGQGRLEDAARYYEHAASILETDVGSPGMLITCYSALGDGEGLRRAARTVIDRAERALAQDPSNGRALGFGVNALAALGEAGRVRDWTERALLVDPDNLNMRYNLACSLSGRLGDVAGAIDMLGPFFDRTSLTLVNHAKADPDLDPLRDDARFQAMLSAAETRLASEAERRTGDG